MGNNIFMKKRLYLIDEYRGFVVLNMIAYHAIWDLVYMFGVDWHWYKSEVGHIWQQWICWSFILVSGFCWQMGKKPLKRGMLVYGAGAVISLVTILVMPSAKVVFGVLTLLGSCMIFMIPLDLFCKKIPKVVGCIVSFFLFVFTYSVNRGYFGFGMQRIIELPKEWYANSFTTYLGFMEKGFYSTDYFSIIPWLFLFMTGYFIYGMLFNRTANNGQGISNDNAIVKCLQRSVCPPLGWIGKHALIIYMLHQPVIYVVLSVWNSLC